MDKTKNLPEGKKSTEENAAPSFLHELPRKNTRRYSILKLLSRYILLLLLAFFSGILFCEASADKLLSAKVFYNDISIHFTKVFHGCSSFKNYASVIVTASAADIRYLLLLFTSGFMYFCGIADSVFVFCKGFTVGFSFRYLISITTLYPEVLKNPNAASAIFLLSELSLALFMAFLATKTLLFAYEFRKLRGRKSRIIKSPLIYRYILLYLTGFGLILILNISACIAALLVYR